MTLTGTPGDGRGGPAPAGRALAYAGVVASVSFWGFNIVLLKWLVGQLPVDAINVVRLGLASVLLLATMALFGGAPRLTTRTTWRLLVAGLIGTTVFQLVYVAGIELSPAGLASVVNATNPVGVALLGAALGERLGRRRWLGIGLSVAGVGLLGLRTLDPESGFSVAGFGLLLAASLSWAAYTVLARPFFRLMSPLQFTALSVAFGSLPYVLLRVPSLSDPAVASAGPAVWLGVAASAVFANYLAFLGWMGGVRVLGATRVSVFQNLTPVVGLAGAAVALGEAITPLLAMAAAVTLAGVYLASSPDRPPHRPVDRPRVAPDARLRP